MAYLRRAVLGDAGGGLRQRTHHLWCGFWKLQNLYKSLKALLTGKKTELD
ncbi:MAG: hypothetical protein V7K98_20080 [Nostoc sp.]